MGELIGIVGIVSLYYITLFNYKYLYWLPVGLVLCVHKFITFIVERNTCTCLYFPGKTPDTGGKTLHTPRAPALPRKSLSGSGGGGWQCKYLCLISLFVCVCVCVCVWENQPKLSIWYIFGYNRPVELEYICFVVNFSKSHYRCTKKEMERCKGK